MPANYAGPDGSWTAADAVATDRTLRSAERSSVHRRRRSFETALVGAIFGAIALLTYLSIAAYVETVRTAETTVRGYAEILAGHLDSALRIGDAEIATLQQQMPLQLQAAPSTQAQSEYWNREFDRRLYRLPELAGLRVFAADGELLYTNQPQSVVRANISDRPHFRRTREILDDRADVSDVLVSRTTGERMVVLSRPLRSGTGQFLGIATTSLQFEYFYKLFTGLDIGGGGVIAIHRSDTFEPIMRWPAGVAVDAKPLPAGMPLRTSVAGGARLVVMRGRSTVDGVDRIFATQTLDRYPFMVTVGLSTPEVLQSWYMRTAAAVASTVVLIAVLFWTFSRLRRAQRSLDSKLEDAVAQRTADLEQTTERLTESNIELQRFAYVASHDLQTPLRSMTLFTQMVEERVGPDLAPEPRQWLGRAIRNGRYMQSMIDDLLEYSRVDSRGTLFKPVDLTDVCRTALELLGPDSDDIKTVVRVQGLPKVMGDAVQLTQVFQNLIGNALKYRSADPPEIEITSQPARGFHVLSVSDNGIGVPEGSLERIFDLFHRQQTDVPGTGIGLAICRRIVQRHGGRIWAQHKPPRGLVIRFTLPSTSGE